MTLQDDTTHNPTRRKLLKGTGVVAASTLIPAATATAYAKNSSKNPASGFTVAELTADGLTLEFADAGVSHVAAELLCRRVSITNNTKDTIQLRNIAPGALNVDGHSYNLNSALVKGPLTIKPDTVRHLWLTPDSYYEPRKNITIDRRSQVANLPVKIQRDTGTSTVYNVKAHVSVG